MQAVFKFHFVHQQSLFPIDLDIFIPKNYSSRFIDSVVEKLEISAIVSQDKGGSNSNYPPKM